jgi:hypothetical protein
MEEKTCLDQVKVAIPVRVRGMSSQNRFFDEQTETDWVGEESVTTHLRNLVELDAEVHLTSLKTHVGGTFRVIWANTKAVNGVYPMGLRLVDAEGNLWAMTFPAAAPGEEGAFPQVCLECQRCHQKLLTPVPEARGEFLCEGFRVARHCEQCKGTAAWGFTTEPQPAAPPASEAEPETLPSAVEAPPAPKPKRLEDHRLKGRARIQFPIKVTRKKYGTPLEDISQTVNVSRNGAYFLSSQNYDVGEDVEVVMNYKEGDLALPVPARVVRVDQPKESFQKGVAIHMTK